MHSDEEGKAKGQRRMSGVMRDQDDKVQRFNEWWEAGSGASAAAAHPLLSAVDAGHLFEIVSAGANYHTILTPDRIFVLQQQLQNGTEPALEPLRRALLSRGGSKGQARAIGTLLFREAMTIFERSGGAAAPQCGHVATVVAKLEGASNGLPVVEAIALDEAWASPRRFINSEGYPAGAQIAARRAPRKDSELVGTFPPGSSFLATGRCGEYLQFTLEDGETVAYVPSAIGGLELLVPAAPEAPPRAPPALSPVTSSAQLTPATAAPAPARPAPDDKENGMQNDDVDPAEKEKGQRNAEGNMRNQENKVQRLMEWWEAGNGASAAAAHPLLSAVDAGHLAEIVGAGANYHTILTTDRIFNLQQQMDSRTEPALEPLRNALLSRGGTKGQARAIGTLLYREAMAIFERCEGAGAAAPPCVAPSGRPVAESVALDEAWVPPRRFVNSEGYPAGAQIAARAAPRRDSDQLATFPAGSDFLATGRCGEYLQLLLEDGKTLAYVPIAIGGLELLVRAAPAASPEYSPVMSPAQFAPAAVAPAPAPPPMPMPQWVAPEVPVGVVGHFESGRVAALEARVAQQEGQIQSLHAELASLRCQLGGIAAAFATLAAPPRR